MSPAEIKLRADQIGPGLSASASIYGGNINVGHKVTIGLTAAQPSFDLSGFGLDVWQDGDFFQVVGVDGVGNSIKGSQGADALFGGDGADILQGFAGNDTLGGGLGYDTLDGGEGIDTNDASLVGGYIWDMVTGVATLAGYPETDVETAVNFENAVTGSGNDRILGTAGSNRIDTGGGNDGVFGRAGDDTIFGGDGDDTVDGGYGLDQLDGGDGFDTNDASFYGGSYVWDMSTGIVTFPFEGTSEVAVNFEAAITGDGNDRIVGTDGANRIVTNGGNDTIVAGAGDDTVDGGDGDDQLDGGDGFDTYDTSSFDGGAYVDLEFGEISFGGMSSGERVIGFEAAITGDGDDFIFGTAGANGLMTSAGDDTVFAGGGNDTVDGGDGDDSITAGEGDDLIRGSAGSDWLDGGDGFDTYDVSFHAGSFVWDMTTDIASFPAGGGTANVYNVEGVIAGDGDDRISGTAGANRIVTGGGADTIAAGGGDDTVDAGGGSDWLDYRAATGEVAVNLGRTVRQTIGADQGRDTIVGVENVIGSAFADTLTGSSTANNLSGGAGDDRLDGGLGADTMLGGAGNDSYTVDNAGDQVVEDSTAGIDDGGRDIVRASISYTLGTLVEDLTLTGTATINGTGQNGANRITGNAAANVLSGGGGNDTLSGDAGFDTLAGGDGADELNGGTGIDYAAYDDANWGNLLIRLDNAALNTGAAAGDRYLSIEGIIGGLGNDTIYGAEALDTLLGGGGDDLLFGGAGNDSLVGGDGGDRLAGGAGADRLVGGGGGGIDYASYEDANWGNLVINMADASVNSVLPQATPIPPSRASSAVGATTRSSATPTGTISTDGAATTRSTAGSAATACPARLAATASGSRRRLAIRTSTRSTTSCTERTRSCCRGPSSMAST